MNFMYIGVFLCTMVVACDAEPEADGAESTTVNDEMLWESDSDLTVDNDDDKPDLIGYALEPDSISLTFSDDGNEYTISIDMRPAESIDEESMNSCLKPRHLNAEWGTGCTVNRVTFPCFMVLRWLRDGIVEPL